VDQADSREVHNNHMSSTQYTPRTNSTDAPIRILLYVAVRSRDLYPMQRIADHLSNNEKYSVILSGEYDFLYAVAAFRPHIILIEKPFLIQGDRIRCISDCTIVSLNAEQGGFDRERVISNFVHKIGERPQALDRVDHHLIGDHRTRDILSEAGVIDSRQMHVVGYPRLLTSTFARLAKPVSKDMVIGIAAGTIEKDRMALFHSFLSFQDEGFEPYENVEAMITHRVLEDLWINSLVISLKERYRIVARCRPDENDYFLESRDVELDHSSSLDYFFANVDLVIGGISTTQIEATIMGIPAISVCGMIRPWEGYDLLKGFWTIRDVWRPNCIDEFNDLVERRSANSLDLAPDMDSYETSVRRIFFAGKTVDRSIENIVAVFNTLQHDEAAIVNWTKVRYLMNPTGRERVAMLISAKAPRLAYRIVLNYYRIRKKIAPKSFLRRVVYVPD